MSFAHQQLVKSLFDHLNPPCRPRVDSAYLRKTFLLLLRSHFSYRDNLGTLEDELGCLLYNPETPEQATLHVELLHSFAPGKRSAWPGVFVGFKGTTFSKISMDNQAQEPGKGYDGSTATRVMLRDSTLVVKCVGRSADQAGLLGDSVCDFLFAVSGDLKDALGLVSFVPAGISEPRLVEPAPETHYACDVTYKMLLPYEVSVSFESHRIKKFAIDLRLD